MFGKKEKYRYDIFSSDNIRQQEVVDTDQLINYVLGIDHDLQSKGEEGWLYIEKVRLGKEEKIIYGEKIDFPLPKNIDVDVFFEKFYTKRALPFTELSENELASLTEKTAQKNATKTTVLPVENPLLKEQKKKTETKEALEKLQQQHETEMAALKDLVVTQQKQNEALQEKIIAQEASLQKVLASQATISEKTSSITKPDTLKLEKETETIPSEKSLEKAEGTSFVLPASEKLSYPSSETLYPDIDEVVEMVQKEFTKQLENFVASETEKMQEELKMLDNRDDLRKKIVEKMDLEEKEAIAQLRENLLDEKKAVLQLEKTKYEEALVTIEQDFDKKFTEKSIAIQEQFTAKKEQEIQAKCSVEAEKLARVLQGKQEVLAMRQKALNDSLKETFKEALSTFNLRSEAVIHALESKKKQSDLVDLSDYVKLAK